MERRTTLITEEMIENGKELAEILNRNFELLERGQNRTPSPTYRKTYNQIVI